MHPHNKRERELIGKVKGLRRARQELIHNTIIKNKFDLLEKQKEIATHREDITKICSCSMCGNPRRYFKHAITKQEFKNEEFAKSELEDFGSIDSGESQPDSKSALGE